MQPLLLWKSNNITYPECVAIALVIQHAKRMPLIILSSVACLVLTYFSTLAYRTNSMVFEEKQLLNTKYVFLCSLLLLS